MVGEYSIHNPKIRHPKSSCRKLFCWQCNKIKNTDDISNEKSAENRMNEDEDYDEDDEEDDEED